MKNLTKNTNPRHIVNRIRKASNYTRHYPRRVMFQHNNTYSDNILAEDWDNLIILDACRYDILKSTNLSSSVEHKIINSSNSLEFVHSYLSNRSYDDTVYITANPFGAQVDQSTFHEKIVTFNNTSSNNKKAEVSNLQKNWSPETVFQASLKALESNPNKRLLIHFMQPHGPYFGKKAKQMRNNLRDKGYKFWAWDKNINRSDMSNDDYILSHLLSAAKRGIINKNTLVDIYKENLDFVLEYVEDLSDQIGGKTVITADHGEMLGESKIFLPSNMGGMRRSIGHGYGIYTSELRKVPYVVLDHTERRTISQGNKCDNSGESINNIDEQLKSLGYK